MDATAFYNQLRNEIVLGELPKDDLSLLLKRISKNDLEEIASLLVKAMDHHIYPHLFGTYTSSPRKVIDSRYPLIDLAAMVEIQDITRENGRGFYRDVDIANAALALMEEYQKPESKRVYDADLSRKLLSVVNRRGIREVFELMWDERIREMNSKKEHPNWQVFLRSEFRHYKRPGIPAGKVDLAMGLF